MADAAEAEGAVATLGSKNVFFIVDNLHRNERLTADLFSAWRDFGSHGQLLLLGRELSGPRGRRAVRPPLASLEDDAIRLVPGDEDLAGVRRRIQLRAGANVDETPPSSHLRKWSTTFGGDLLAFAAANAAQAHGGRWEDEPAARDARDYIWDLYLADLDPSEMEDIRIVASLATIEMETPASAMSRPTLSRSLKDGRVQRTMSQIGRATYRLPHPGIGSLILEALDADPLEPSLLLAVAQADTEAGSELVWRLRAGRRRTERRNEAERALLLQLTASAETFARAAITYPSGPAAFLKRIQRQHLLTSEEIDQQLAGHIGANVPRLVSQAPWLYLFIKKSRANYPRSRRALLEELAGDSTWRTLQLGSARGQRSALRLLKALRTDAPPAASSLTNELRTEERGGQLLAQVDRMRLAEIAEWIEFAHLNGAEWTEPFLDELQSGPARRRLMGKLRRANPSSVAALVRDASEYAPALGASLSDTIEQEPFADSFARRVARLPPPERGKAISRLDGVMPGLHSASIAEALRIPAMDHASRLARNELRVIFAELTFLEHVAPDYRDDVLSALATPKLRPAVIAQLVAADESGQGGVLRTAERTMPELAEGARRAVRSGSDARALVTAGPLSARLHALRILLRDPRRRREAMRLVRGQMADGTLADAIVDGPSADGVAIIRLIRRTGRAGRNWRLSFDRTHGRNFARNVITREGVSAVAAFVTAVEELLPETYKHAVDGLRGELGAERAVAWASEEELRLVVIAADDLRDPTREIYAALVASAKPVLHDRLLTAAPVDVLDFLSGRLLSEEVVAALEKDRWEESWTRRSAAPAQMAEFGRRLHHHGRPDLAEAPARAAVSAPTSTWDGGRADVGAVSHLLRLAKGAPPATRLSFIERSGGIEWLRTAYTEADADSLVGHMYGMWAHQERELIQLVQAAAPGDALNAKLDRFQDSLVRTRILAASVLLDVRLAAPDATADVVAELARQLEETGPNQRGFTWSEVVLWSGVRAVADEFPGEIEVKPGVGKRVQDGFGTPWPITRRQVMLADEMRIWLAACAESGWVLTGTSGSLRERLVSTLLVDP
jgi:hypothetical protein